MLTIFDVLNSDFFVGIITFLVGTFAYLVYRKQKRDEKRDAANIILLEIENAERQLGVIAKGGKTSERLNEEIKLMKNASWDKYCYHFVRDFDRNEWDKISDFYDKCLQYDAAVETQVSNFNSDTIKIQEHMQRVISDYAKNCTDIIIAANDDAKIIAQAMEDYEDKKSRFYNIFTGGNYAASAPRDYLPSKFSMEARSALETIDKNLSLTSVGMKLKKMTARSRNRSKLTKNGI